VTDGASSNDPGLERVRRAALVEWEAMAPGWERRREEVRDFFQGISDWMVARLDPRPGQTILELGAGTGETGFAAARLIGESGRLISTDLPPAMVEVARRRARELGIGNAEFHVMDAEQTIWGTPASTGSCVGGPTC
jgi:SAM-dependent methyltransferase